MTEAQRILYRITRNRMVSVANQSDTQTFEQWVKEYALAGDNHAKILVALCESYPVLKKK